MSQPPQMRVSMPDDKVPGVYADFVSVWHTADVFTFDFAALSRPPARVEGDDGTPVTQAPADRVGDRDRPPTAPIPTVARGQVGRKPVAVPAGRNSM